MSSAPPPGAGAALERLDQLIARLRAPDGCPWDRQQTTTSVTPYLLEEAFEAAEAVESGQPAEARGELGDLLFQVVFMVRLYQEQGHFDLRQVIEAVHAKMTRRHPHVFGDQDAMQQAEQVRDLWGQIKKQERRDSGQGLLQSVPRSAPALVVAQRMGSRAARVGFDWRQAHQVLDKVAEECRELRQAGDDEQAAAELGDLFFALAQWARHRGLDSEACLRAANRRFLRRFSQMEEILKQRGLAWESLSLEQMNQLWEEVKAAE